MRWATCGLCALLVNAALFILPLLVANPELPDEAPDNLGAVRLSALTTPRTETSEQNAADTPRPETLQEIMPRETFDTAEAVEQPKLDFDLPQVEFDINPALAEGMAVPAVSAGAELAAPAALPAGGALAIGELDERPALLFAPEPPYPMQAKRRGLAGCVRARLLVDERGNVARVEIVDGENSDVFAQSVRITLERWRFRPGSKDGRPVCWTAIVPVTFDRE